MDRAGRTPLDRTRFRAPGDAGTLEFRARLLDVLGGAARVRSTAAIRQRMVIRVPCIVTAPLTWGTALALHGRGACSPEGCPR